MQVSVSILSCQARESLKVGLEEKTQIGQVFGCQGEAASSQHCSKLPSSHLYEAAESQVFPGIQFVPLTANDIFLET